MLPHTIALPFLAGCLTVVLVHQPLVAIAVSAGLAPEVWQAWSTEPLAPSGVPAILSQTFWGGVWAVVIDRLARERRGAVYWLTWILAGALAPVLVAIYVVPVLKGGEPLDFWSRFPPGAAINALWAGSIALLLWRVRRE